MMGDPRMGQEFAYKLPFRVSVVCDDDDSAVYIDDEGRVPQGAWSRAEALAEVEEVVRRRFHDLATIWDLKFTFEDVDIFCEYGAAYGILTIRGGIPLAADDLADGYTDLVQINSMLRDQSMFGKKQTILNRLGR